MKRLTLLGGIALAAVPSLAAAQTTYLDLGQYKPMDVSPDGTTLYGIDASGNPATYDVGTGTITPYPATGFATVNGGISADSSRFVASMPEAVTNFDTAAYWDGTQWITVGGLGAQSGNSQSTAYELSSDGTTIVGLGWINAGTAHAFHYDIPSGTMTDLGSLGGRSTRANGVNQDGTIVYGWDESPGFGNRRPAIWVNGAEQLLGTLDPLDPDNVGEAWEGTPDGSVVVGGAWNGAQTEAFRYENGMMTGLGLKDPTDPFDQTTAMAISDDGQIVAGNGGDPFFGIPYAWIWDSSAGLQDLGTYLTSLGANVTTSPTQVTGMSGDGSIICGIAGGFPFTSGYIAMIDNTTTYCTGKVNSQGCTPFVVHSAGSPSVSSVDPYFISASDAINNKNGLLFYGISGRASLPFFGATLCVNPPLRRTTIQNSMGNAGPDDCSGSLLLDMNAWIQGGNDANLVPGQMVNAQFWMRDPANSDGTGVGLSDALETTVAP